MKKYALDNSAIIHLASLEKHHANSFRFAVTLNEKVDPETLQKALENITYRFPTILAGIKAGYSSYSVVPVSKAPHVMEDTVFLATMSMKEIQNHAFRVLYKENQISIEIFHAMTDGHGAITLLRTLLAEYVRLKEGVSVATDPMLLDKNEKPKKEEVSDDYFKFASKGKEVGAGKFSYQLPTEMNKKHEIKSETYTYNTKELLSVARLYGVSLTTLLTTVMLTSILQIQKEHAKDGKCRQPVQVMVPMNLRSLYPSKSLRNFILCAFPSIKPRDSHRSFEELLPIVEKQLKEQLTKEHMSSMMLKYTKLERLWLLKLIPLALKNVIVQWGHHNFGEKKSCITLTNLGMVRFPEQISKKVDSIEVFLTPRRQSLYNCGIISYGENCTINFSRLCDDPILERVFVKKLEKVMKKN